MQKYNIVVLAKQIIMSHAHNMKCYQQLIFMSDTYPTSLETFSGQTIM